MVLTILKNMSQLGRIIPIYEMENKSQVWNHQQVYIYNIYVGLPVDLPIKNDDFP